MGGVLSDRFLWRRHWIVHSLHAEAENIGRQNVRERLQCGPGRDLVTTRTEKEKAPFRRPLFAFRLP